MLTVFSLDVTQVGMDPLAGGLALSGGFEQPTDSPKPEGRHVVIDILVLSLRNHVGLVPNPHVPAVPDALAKPPPGRKMSQIRLPRVSHESLKGLPVLKKKYRPAKPNVASFKTKIGPAPKLGQHPRHLQEDRQPLMNFPCAIDSHSNEEDAEWLLHPCRHAFGYDHDRVARFDWRCPSDVDSSNIRIEVATVNIFC